MSYADDFTHLQIQLKDIEEATDDFRDKPIGTGGFGAVYKGELLLPEGRRMVAFKRLNRQFGQGDVEFWKEITMLSGLSHENLASLLGFCMEGDERILVYEYASRQSLDGYLDKASLTWTQRLKICIGAARGIAYLHDPKKKQQRVLHRDIKSSNILLDDTWTAKVSDFGLSKVTPANQSRTYLVSNVAGTLGYLDPVYHETGILSKESDVYSFGVVLFEVMCGRLCCEVDKDKLICILVQSWKNRCDDDELDDIIFPHLKQHINQESLSTFVAIAKRCLNRDHKERPNMIEVVKELEVALYQQQYCEKKTHDVLRTSLGITVDIDFLKVPLEYIKLATNNFSDKKLIGRGEYGQAYKGELSLPGGKCMVHFKRFDYNLRYRGGFWSEIDLLSNYKHENFVSLLCFCEDSDEMIIGYSYASRGSLDKHLSSRDLSWTQRLKISVGVAHAINYLHEPDPDTKNIVLHRDIKSLSILLEEDWTPKVSDFGTSGSDPIPGLAGTPGYCDPCYMRTDVLTKESDVYSFGVVLCELMSGRLCTEYLDGRPFTFVSKWIGCYDEKRLDRIIFPFLHKQMDVCSLNTFSSIAYRCLERNREDRPTIGKVMKELEIALEQQEDFEETMRTENLLLRSPDGVLVGYGTTWLSKHVNGKVCEIISATKCIYADSLVRDDRQNSSYRFSNVVAGGMHNGFTIKVTTQFLSTQTTYMVSLIFKHNATDQGSHIPFKFKVNKERHYTNMGMIHVRDDGWLMIELYQFTSYKRKHDLRIHFLPLFNISSSSIKYFLEGVEFRPVQYVSQ